IEIKKIINTKTKQKVITIYGHSNNENESTQQDQAQKNKSIKRVYDQDNHVAQKPIDHQSQSVTKPSSIESDQEESQLDEDASNSISEAGEVENEAYKIPPLTLLKQPAKQKTTSKAEVQKKGQ